MIDTLSITCYKFDINLNKASRHIDIKKIYSKGDKLYSTTGKLSTDKLYISFHLIEEFAESPKNRTRFNVQVEVPNILGKLDYKLSDLPEFNVLLQSELNRLGITYKDEDLTITRMDLYVDVVLPKPYKNYKSLLRLKRQEGRLPLSEDKYATSVYWENTYSRLNAYDKKQQLDKKFNKYQYSRPTSLKGLELQEYTMHNIYRAYYNQQQKGKLSKIQQKVTKKHLMRIEYRFVKSQKVKGYCNTNLYTEIVLNAEKMESLKDEIMQDLLKFLFSQELPAFYKMHSDVWKGLNSYREQNKSSKSGYVVRYFALQYMLHLLDNGLDRDMVKSLIEEVFIDRKLDTTLKNAKSYMTKSVLELLDHAEMSKTSTQSYNKLKKREKELESGIIDAFNKL